MRPSSCRSAALRTSPRAFTGMHCAVNPPSVPSPTVGIYQARQVLGGREGAVRRILIAEDDHRAAAFLSKGLRASGLTPSTVTDADMAVGFALSGTLRGRSATGGSPPSEASVIAAPESLTGPVRKPF